jgi:hypothetical protein
MSSLLAAAPDIELPDGTFMHGPLLGSQEPRFRTVPARHREKDPDCRACRLGTDYACGCGDYKSSELLPWAERFGYDLDPWQADWLADACGTQPDGRWAAFECLCICCRQNGKNQDLEVRELGGLFLLGESLIIHTAHEFKASREHFRRVSDTINGYNELRSKVKSISTSHGEEAIELRPKPTLIFGSGGRQIRKSVSARLRFLARSRGSGRSFTADVVVYDEAMILSDEQVGASMPTMRAVPNPQLYYTASAGMHDSTQLAAVRRRMIRQDPSLMGYEWSISPHTDTCPRDEVHGRKANRYVVCSRHDDRDDPRSWAKSNPAFGTRIRLDHFRKELTAMSPAAFDRELLGVGDWPPEEEAWEIVTEEAWQACAMEDPGGALRPVAFAWDVAEDLLSATIASAWDRPDPGWEVTVNEKRTVISSRVVLEIPRGCSREGSAWVISRLAELKRKWKPIAICAPTNGPGASLIDDAEKAGIEVLKAGSADEAAALALFRAKVRDRGIIHLGKEQAPGLRAAIATATTRDVGDGGKALKRRDAETDITPATTAALAHWALNKKRRSYDPMRSVR